MVKIAMCQLLEPLLINRRLHQCSQMSKVGQNNQGHLGSKLAISNHVFRTLFKVGLHEVLWWYFHRVFEISRKRFGWNECSTPYNLILELLISLVGWTKAVLYMRVPDHFGTEIIFWHTQNLSWHRYVTKS